MNFDDVIIRRFWRYVNKDGNNILHWPELSPCWEWTGGLDSKGYGHFNLPNQPPSRAHKFSWLINKGSVVTGENILHHCDNRPCVRPSHLYEGTLEDNMKDMWDRGRHASNAGSNNGRAKITEEQAKEIKRLGKIYVYSYVARLYDITEATVSKIVLGRTWKNV